MKKNKNEIYIIIVAIFLVVILLCQRLAIPLSGSDQSKQIPAAVFIMYAFLGLSWFKKKLEIEIYRFILFIIISCSVLIVSLFSNQISFFSMFYLLGIYIPFVLFADISAEQYQKILRTYQIFMLIFALAGIGQILLIFAGVPFFDVFSLLPAQFLQTNYNTQYPIVYGSPIIKSNGVIFLEPSFYSQFLSLALIIEIVYFQKIHRIILFLLAMLTSFSGTGLIMLVAAAPFMLSHFVRKPKLRIALTTILILLAVLTAVAGSYGFGDYYSRRMNEFGAKDSSASIRFIAPYKALTEVVSVNPIWRGSGAGAADDLKFNYEVNFPATPKVIIEYGFVTGSIFTIFLIYCFGAKQRSFSVALACAIMYFFLSGSLLQPQVTYVLFLLTIFFPQSDTG